LSVEMFMRGCMIGSREKDLDYISGEMGIPTWANGITAEW